MLHTGALNTGNQTDKLNKNNYFSGHSKYAQDFSIHKSP